MAAELISVVLCTYNGDRFIEQQLDSILSQTYPNIEIIIFDDASTDGTMSVLQKYLHHSNIYIHFNEMNIGFAKNFEKAALLAKANYICFADQDDIWLPNKIELLYSNIKDKTIIYSNSLLIDENGNSLNKYLSDYRKLQNINDSKGFAFMNAVTGHTMMIKRDLLKKALPIPENTYHDWWLAVNATSINGIKYLDAVLTYYRQHSKNVTKTIVVKQRGSRTKEKRLKEFNEKLLWLQLLKEKKDDNSSFFFSQLYNLYQQKNKNKFVWTLFFFMLNNRKCLFRFSTKGFFSQLVEIRKLARGEKN